MLFIGRLGTDYLAAAALATMFANVTGFSLVVGMTSALDTLCSQAHTGSSDPHALGKHLQRSFLIVILVCIPVAFLWSNTSSLLILVGQDPKLATLSGQFLVHLIPGLLPISIAECLKRYLQAQAIMKAPLFILIFLSPVNVLLQYLFVFNPSTAIGFLGAPIALSIVNCLILSFYILYIRFIQGGDAWGGFCPKEMFNTRLLWEFVKLGIPGCLMMCSEWWAFEIMALLAGILGEKTLAAQSILYFHPHVSLWN
jgi:MATE family multidrug resistance protein